MSVHPRTIATEPAIYVFSNFTLGGGKLTVSATSDGIFAQDNIYINGGILSATTSYNESGEVAAITARNEDHEYGVVISGGQVTATATGTGKGIWSSNGNITLGYKNTNDFIEVSSYYANKVKIADDRAMFDGTYTYNSSTPSNTLKALTNKRLRPMTYKVAFDKNNANATGEMTPVVATYGLSIAIPACTFTVTSGYYVLKEWNTATDGTGTSFEVDGYFSAPATEQDATVTLYAQWAKDISTCTATASNSIYHSSSYHGYFYDGTWNTNHGGIKVFDSETLLTYGTDYYFSMLESRDGGYCDELGENCRVILEGIGAYAGKLTADVVIVPDTVIARLWGDLTWSLDEDGKFTIIGSGTMKAAASYYEYPWYHYSSYITSITIGENITTVAAKAFGGTDQVNPYGSVNSISLPATLTEIGENAFAYCTGLTYNADNLLARDVIIGENAFNNVGCIEGTLQDNGDNSKMLNLMGSAQASNVTLSGRTLSKSGEWNTLCLPFSLNADGIADSPLAGATIMALDVEHAYNTEGETIKYTSLDTDDGKLYLFFKDATEIVAGKPYIIKWENTEGKVSDPTFTGVRVYNDAPTPVISKDGNVTFVGQYSPFSIVASGATGDNQGNLNEIIMMSANNMLGYSNNTRTLKCFRAHFYVPATPGGAKQAARSIVMDFGDSQEIAGIVSFDNEQAIDNSGAWYSLDGRKLNGKPTAKGLYIQKGRKVVVK